MTDASATDVRFPEPDSEDQPDGWEYNPSSWSERFPLVGLALLGLGIAAYLSAFQLGLIRTIWDPFFGGGARSSCVRRIRRCCPFRTPRSAP